MATLVEIATEPATTELGWMGLPNDSEESICRAYFYLKAEIFLFAPLEGN